MHFKTKTNTELQQMVGSTLNNRSTTTEPPPWNGQQPQPKLVLFRYPWWPPALLFFKQRLQNHTCRQTELKLVWTHWINMGMCGSRRGRGPPPP